MVALFLGFPLTCVDKLIIPEDKISNSLTTKVADKCLISRASPAKRKTQTAEKNASTWTEKYRPKVPSDIIGNQSLVCALVLIFLPSLLELNSCLHLSNSGQEL